MLCSILLLDTEKNCLLPGAAPSLPDFYNDAIEGLVIGDGVGSCGTAAFRGERVIVENIHTHPYWAPYKELATQAELASCWSQPILNSEAETLGTFAIYHRKPAKPSEFEIQLIESYANLSALVIETCRAENEVRIAATAFESQEGILVTDANKCILRVNRAFSRITGYSAEEVLGNTPSFLSSGKHDAAFYDSMWEYINQTGYWEGEIWNKRKNGEIYPEQLAISAVIAPSGSVSNYVATLTDITLRKEAADKIERLAYYDPLTHLPNRRLLVDRLSQAIINSARKGNDGALLFLDLDHFKTLNDTLGHDIGDMLLIQVAHRLKLCVREGDSVARLGGDEFVIILEDLSCHSIDAAAQTELVAQKILYSLNQPYQLVSELFTCTVSIGATLFNKRETSVDGLLKQADIAMYQAKKVGRNTLRFFDQQMQEAINVRADMERELKKAIEHKQFELYYQVQIDKALQPLGAEALIRWVHPERGLIAPLQFIPLAEEIGLIIPIGQWVLESACAQLSTWANDPKTSALTLSVNVSSKQFQQEDFVAQVREAISQHQINPSRLKLELTESLLLENTEETIASMSELGALGVQLSLDDFGTGYSSLQYLKRLPLYQLKIDQSFVRDLTFGSRDQTIVRTIIAMAESLGLNVIAEGVETHEQLQCLLRDNCPNFQGYLFSKPVPIEEFMMLVTEEKIYSRSE
jgi:diguanylate cyclase (GGDEF)-like protein/PAS domain S-box-containing protein